MGAEGSVLMLTGPGTDPTHAQDLQGIPQVLHLYIVPQNPSLDLTKCSTFNPHIGGTDDLLQAEDPRHT